MSVNQPLQKTSRYWYLVLPILFLFVNCKSKNEINNNSTTSDAKESTEVPSNMKMGVVVDYSVKSDECGFLIELENEETLLQALEIPKEFMFDGKKVWIDYTLSRRQQGPCIYGNPIIINEIKTRE